MEQSKQGDERLSASFLALEVARNSVGMTRNYFKSQFNRMHVVGLRVHRNTDKG